jgi:hypothetical protein
MALGERGVDIGEAHRCRSRRAGWCTSYPSPRWKPFILTLCSFVLLSRLLLGMYNLSGKRRS